jgi:hypothetical protein
LRKGEVTENTPVPTAGQQTVQAVSRPAVFIPEVPIMAKQTYASAMSYVGFTRRMTAWVRKTGTTPVTASLAWTAAILGGFAMWCVILPIYYLFTVVLFGWFMVPFRLIRRSHRKQEHVQKTQLATMQAMLVSQQQTMLENRDRGL